MSFAQRAFGFQAFLLDNFATSTIRSADQNNRETHKFRFGANYTANQHISMGVLTDYLNFKDSRNIAINSTNRSSTELFSKYAFNDSAYIALSGGWVRNSQIEVTDKGSMLELESNIRKQPVFDMVASAELKVKEEAISPRRNQANHFSLVLETPEALSLKNEFHFFIERQRNDFYVLSDSITNREMGVVRNIQQRSELNYGIENRLANVNFSPELSAGLYAAYISRQIDKNYFYMPQAYSSSVVPNQINEFRIETQADFSYRTSVVDSRFKILFQERDERRVIPRRANIPELTYNQLLQTEELMNNTSKRISLSWATQLQLSKSDQLSIIGSHSKLQYDTPSDMNYDDRDELLSIVRVNYVKQLFPFFSVGAMLEGTLHHLVYIHSARSSNNDENKILRFQAATDLQFDDFTNHSTIDILSNYTIYDYEDINQSLRSFSFRQMLANDSLLLVLGRKLLFKGTGYLKISEQGSMNWKKFTMAPLRENHEQFLHLQLVTSWHSVSYAIGMRYFTVKGFTYAVRVKTQDYSYKSIGPSVEITAKMKEYLQFRLSGWYEFITRLNEPAMRQSTFQINCIINL